MGKRSDFTRVERDSGALTVDLTTERSGVGSSRKVKVLSLCRKEESFFGEKIRLRKTRKGCLLYTY